MLLSPKHADRSCLHGCKRQKYPLLHRCSVMSIQMSPIELKGEILLSEIIIITFLKLKLYVSGEEKKVNE